MDFDAAVSCVVLLPEIQPRAHHRPARIDEDGGLPEVRTEQIVRSEPFERERQDAVSDSTEQQDGARPFGAPRAVTTGRLRGSLGLIRSIPTEG